MAATRTAPSPTPNLESLGDQRSRSFTRRPGGSLLAILDPDRSDDRAVQWVARRARAFNAELVLVCVWSPSRAIGFASLVGEDPRSLLDAHARKAASWLRERLADLPDDVSVTHLCAQGPVHRLVSEVMRERHYDGLIVDGALRPRVLARIRRRQPDLDIAVVPGADPGHR
jgi:hypothetical protein